MAEVYGWGAKIEDGSEYNISVREYDEGEMTVDLELNTYDGKITTLLAPKEARELARDLNAAAKAATK